MPLAVKEVLNEFAKHCKEFSERKWSRFFSLVEFPADADNATIESTVMADEQSQKWIDGKTPKKVIIVPKKIVNIVL